MKHIYVKRDLFKVYTPITEDVACELKSGKGYEEVMLEAEQDGEHITIHIIFWAIFVVSYEEYAQLAYNEAEAYVNYVESLTGMKLR